MKTSEDEIEGEQRRLEAKWPLRSPWQRPAERERGPAPGGAVEKELTGGGRSGQHWRNSLPGWPTGVTLGHGDDTGGQRSERLERQAGGF